VQEQLTTSEESRKRLEELEQQVAAFQAQLSEKHGASETQRAELDASRSEVAALRKNQNAEKGQKQFQESGQFAEGT
jgi:uncharacterized coiled-coil DUF342 family protein